MPLGRAAARNWLEYLLALSLCSLLYFWADALSRFLTFEYYDNGETLQHTLNLLHGLVPYRQDYNHHFFGYLLPFVLLSKLFGVSSELLTAARFLFQILTALGVFALCRMRLNLPAALTGAALCVTARAPLAFAFYPQHEIAAFLVWMLYLCLQAVQGKPTLGWAALLGGIAFSCDQRAIMLLLIPTAAWAYRAGRQSDARARALLRDLLIPAALAPGAAIAYLALNQALLPAWEQTVIFPFLFRSASLGLWEKLVSWFWVHRYILNMTPILCALALLGALALATKRLSLAAGERQVHLAAGAALFGMTFFSGRDFQYYTIPFNPLLAYLAVCSTAYFCRLALPAQRLLMAALWAPVALALLQSYRSMSNLPPGGFNDGANETLTYLRDQLAPQDRLLVWGYRMDLQARLGRPSDYAFGNQIMIHPDRSITDAAERRQHVYAKYEALFFEELRARPPAVIVTFDKPELAKLRSEADLRIKQLLAANYNVAFEITRSNIANEPCTFRVFKLRP